MEKRVKPVETETEKMARLLTKAHEQGIQLLMDHDTERWYATSGTVENIIYAVSERGCTCQGFKAFKRCKHFALFMDRRTPPTPEQQAARITERAAAMAARNNLEHARAWLTSLIERQEAGEIVPEADVREAIGFVARYAEIVGSTQPVQLAA